MSNLAPSGNLVQQEALQFNQPVSEASAASIGALANYLRYVILPVGSVVYSMLSELDFQDECMNGSPVNWLLANGQSCSGSRYEFLTGNSLVPDLRGIFIRGRNYGRSGGTGNPDGDLAVGTYTADRFASHSHGVTDPGHIHGVTDPTHSHGTTDPGHAHGYSDPTHTHGVTDPGHQHDIEVHVSPSNLGGRVNAANDTATSAVYGNNNIKTAGTNVSINAATVGIAISANITSLSVNTGATNISVNSGTTGVTTNASGSSETAPRNMTLNAFIRIN